MVTPRYIPERGNLVWLTFTPQAGHEQAGRRPALVLSPRAYNAKTGLALFCPITSQVKGYAFEVPLPDGLSVSGVVLADQVRSLDFVARSIAFADTAPQTLVTNVLQRLILLL